VQLAVGRPRLGALGGTARSVGAGRRRRQRLECRTHVLVDNRKLLQVLEGQQVNPMAAACSILSDIPLHLDVSL
jgi:hypothetical protein